MNKENSILGFQGKYKFLSNFWEVEVYLEGQDKPYLSVENAYQASKTTDHKVRELIRKYSPEDAKTLGQNMIIRPDWNDELRIKTMRELLHQKFDCCNVELVQKFLATGDAMLVESNNCDGKRASHLGKLLMEVRFALVLEKGLIHNFLVNNTSSKAIAEDLGISEKKLYQKQQAYNLLYIYPTGAPTQSANWDEAIKFMEENSRKALDGFPFFAPFPQMYGGQEYEIITMSGEKYTASVDDSREFMSEGLEWKTIGKKRDGNKDRYSVVAWKLLLK